MQRFGINLIRCDGEFALHQLIHQETIQVGSGLLEETFQQFEASHYQATILATSLLLFGISTHLKRHDCGTNLKHSMTLAMS